MEEKRTPVAYKLFNGAVVHCRCRERYQKEKKGKKFWGVDVVAYIKVVYMRGHPLLPCPCAQCNKEIK